MSERLATFSNQRMSILYLFAAKVSGTTILQISDSSYDSVTIMDRWLGTLMREAGGLVRNA